LEQALNSFFAKKKAAVARTAAFALIQLQLLLHQLVGNAGFHEGLACCFIAIGQVKRDGLSLGVQVDGVSQAMAF
jgi:hypothetical protein